MNKYYPHIFLMFIFFGCSIKSREEAIAKREAELLNKEQQLILKEKTLELKEMELCDRENQIYNSKIDTSLAIENNQYILGEWEAKMHCIETTCSGSAVGDTKSEKWDFSFEENTLIAKAKVRDKLIRVYTGSISGKSIELKAQVDPDSSALPIQILVHLTINENNFMEGQREILRDNDCKIIYNLELKK